MQQRLIELHQQRGRLLERIATQRRTLSLQARPVTHALRFGDRIRDWAEQGKSFALEHPVAVGAVVTLVVVLRPSGVLRWSRRSLMAWRTWITLRAFLPRFLAERL